MSSVASTTSAASERGDALDYRALPTGAIIGLAMAGLSLIVPFSASNSLQHCLLVCPIPVVGFLVSWRTWRKIKQEPTQWTGAPITVAGMFISLAFLIGGLAYGGYVYSTEVPLGYTRISFIDMATDEIDRRNGTIVPNDISKLVGTKVFIKGYIRPNSVPVEKNIDELLFVRDNNECCYGDLSKVKYYDQIQVDMQGSLRVDFERRLFRLGGTLAIQPKNLLRGPGYPVYYLKADYAQ